MSDLGCCLSWVRTWGSPHIVGLSPLQETSLVLVTLSSLPSLHCLCFLHQTVHMSIHVCFCFIVWITVVLYYMLKEKKKEMVKPLSAGYPTLDSVSLHSRGLLKLPHTLTKGQTQQDRSCWKAGFKRILHSPGHLRHELGRWFQGHQRTKSSQKWLGGTLLSIKSTSYQDELSILNIYVPNARAFTSIKENLLKLKAHITPHTLIVGDFKITL